MCQPAVVCSCLQEAGDIYSRSLSFQSIFEESTLSVYPTESPLSCCITIALSTHTCTSDQIEN